MTNHGLQLSQLNYKPYFYSVTGEKADMHKKIIGKKEALNSML